MRFVFLLYFLIVFQINYSQPSILTGDWKVISVENKNIYFDVKKDSIFLFSAFENLYSDSEIEIKQVNIDIMKNLYRNHHFFFKDKICIQSINQSSIEYNYRINQTNKTIEMLEVDSPENFEALEMPYFIKDGLLYLTIISKSPEKFVLERIR